MQWLLATYLPPNVEDRRIASFYLDHNLFFSVVLIQINAGLPALDVCPFEGWAFNGSAFAIGFLQQDSAMPRIFLVALIIAATLRAEGIAQVCNPAIDGTYCAEQMGKRPDGAVTTSRSNPSLGREAFSIVRDNDPATFGAITFGGGTGCIGILRRSSCN